MTDISMGVGESRFADMIWESEPISSSALWKRCEGELGWKKSTTFTVLKRLCEKGIFKNEGGMVSSVLSREEFYAMQSERFVKESFGGSLPAFVAAFTARKKLTPREIEDLRRMIESYEED